MFESERLARELFDRSASGHQAENLSSLHPEAQIAPSYDAAITVSRADLEAHLMSEAEPAVMEARADKYTPVDDERIIVEGQVCVRRGGGGFDYRPTVWALIFRDGLLYRSWAVRSFRDAEARLAASSET
jgi:hypothetical protein